MTTAQQRLDEARRRIHGSEPVVVVEAAAGCGKTHEAVAAALALGQSLQPGQEVLLLTHTNAARDVFESRIREERAPARMQTIDSLAFEIVQRYAPHLDLAQPILPDSVHAGHPSFHDIERHAAELLHEAPAVAEGLAWRHPVLLVDEHQDSSPHQHQIVERIGAADSTRVRYFGDRLQVIYDFAGGGDAWGELCAEHVPVVLDHGHRWNDNPALRDWLLLARNSLLGGQAIPLQSRPDCVHLHHWTGTPPAPTTKGHCPDLIAQLSRLVLCGDRRAVLVCDGTHGRGLTERLASSGFLLFEGADVTSPRHWLEQALSLEGQPHALARLLAEVMRDWGTGVPKSKVDEISHVCTADGINLGKRTLIAPLVELCNPLYETPTASVWLTAFGSALASRQRLNWRVIRRDAAWLLAATPTDGDDLIGGLLATSRARARTVKRPSTAVMTVHRAKGSEFDCVVLPYISGSNFGPSPDDAKKLYVALTRAQRVLHLCLSVDDPSPRFRL
jgi:hypothetical protein